MEMADKKMMSASRTKNAVLNIFFGYIAQIGILILSFIGRKIFLNFLSVEYLGINGLYSNILTILSLPELGLDTAVVYSLYKPVAENDINLVSSLLRFFKKIYYILAFSVFAIGLLLTPFMKYIVNTDMQQDQLIFYYILFLINTIVSYFMAHKIALLSAKQEMRFQQIVTLSVSFFSQIIYIIVLMLWKNYYIYLITTICSTIISNLILSVVCSRIHPEVFKNTDIVLFDKKPIFERITSTFLYKIGAVLINSTDNILISVLVGTIAVGQYSNYYVVIGAIQRLLTVITTSLLSGIGNLAVAKEPKKQLEIFDTLLLFYHFAASIGLIGFSLLFNNLITLWLGSEYLFDGKTVCIISLNFYLTNAISPVWMFRESNGMFDKVKFLILIRAALNIVFSVLLGMFWGVFGIFLATAISLILTNFWVEPKILFNEIMHTSYFRYWKYQLKYFIITLISFVCSYFAIYCMGEGWLMLFIKATIIVLITFGIFLIATYKSREFRRIKEILKKK